MKVLPINNTQPQFKAKVIPTQDYKNLIEYLSKHKEDKTSLYNSAENLNLVKYVTQALEKFPTSAELKFGVMCRLGELYNARGVVKSQYTKYIDSEPASSNSVVPIPNIMKRILNPQNSAFLNKLMGNSDDKARTIWWDTYILPKWNSIKAQFFEDTIYPREAQPDFDLMFRRSNTL